MPINKTERRGRPRGTGGSVSQPSKTTTKPKTKPTANGEPSPYSKGRGRKRTVTAGKPPRLPGEKVPRPPKFSRTKNNAYTPNPSVAPPGAVDDPIPGMVQLADLPWAALVTAQLAYDKPSREVFVDWCEIQAMRHNIPGGGRVVADYLNTHQPSLVTVHVKSRKASANALAREAAALFGLTRVAPLKVIKEAMSADKITVGEDGTIHSDPDHRTRLVAANLAVNIFGMEAPAKVEVDATPEVKEIARADIMIRMAELTKEIQNIARPLETQHATQSATSTTNPTRATTGVIETSIVQAE